MNCELVVYCLLSTSAGIRVPVLSTVLYRRRNRMDSEIQGHDAHSVHVEVSLSRRTRSGWKCCLSAFTKAANQARPGRTYELVRTILHMSD